MATKWKLIVDTELTVNEDDDEVGLYINRLESNGQYDVKWHPDTDEESTTGFFTGYSCTGDSPHGAIDLIPTHWKWYVDLSKFKDKDWAVRLYTKGLEVEGHTNVHFNPSDSTFTGSATEEIPLPPGSIVIG